MTSVRQIRHGCFGFSDHQSHSTVTALCHPSHVSSQHNYSTSQPQHSHSPMPSLTRRVVTAQSQHSTVDTATAQSQPYTTPHMPCRRGTFFAPMPIGLRIGALESYVCWNRMSVGIICLYHMSVGIFVWSVMVCLLPDNRALNKC